MPRARDAINHAPLSSDLLVKQPCEIVRGVARPRGWPSCFPPGRRVFVPSAKPRGRSAEWRPVPSTPCGASPPTCASPLPLAKGTRRPSALRTALDGLRGRTPFDGAFPALALVVAVIGSDRGHERSLCRWADPRAARAPCLQGTKAQAPYPAPPSDASGAPSSERGWWTICSGKSS